VHRQNCGASLSRKAPEATEAAIQRAVLDHLRWRAKTGWLFWATPNAGKRSPWLGADLRKQGMTAGVGDLSLVSPTGHYHELELKTPTGRLRPAQRERLELLQAAGVPSDVAYGLDSALAILAGWGAIA